MTHSASLTRRELLAAGIGTMMAGAAAAQPAPLIPSSSRELWQWVRMRPVLEPHAAYLDVASAGPTLRAAMAAEYRARDAHSFSIASFDAARWVAETQRLAGRFAEFIGCSADEVHFTTGAGDALAQVAAGLDLHEGDEVLTTRLEHPAALAPWLTLARRRGVLVKQIELPAPLSGPEQALGLFAGAVTDRTRVMLFSHVNYADGAVMPVRELGDFARQRNIMTVVDGAQALGMIDLDVSGLNCDFYATCCHKWLGAPRGTGLLYVRREALDRLWPTAPRGLDPAPPLETPTQEPGRAEAPAALRKLGNLTPYAWSALRGVEAAMELHQQIGRARIEARVRELAIYARLRLQQFQDIEILTPARPGLWAGLLTFRGPRSAEDAAVSLVRGHRVHVRALSWPGAERGALRASFHVFNTHDEIERLMRGLAQALR